MARVKIPLLSGSAHGTIAKCLTFSKRKTGQKARFQRKQNYAPTAAQKIRRFWCAQAVLAWQALTPTEKKSYNKQTIGKTITGYNLFISQYLKTIPGELGSSIFGIRIYGIYNYGKQL